jgi:hypothetical protein
VSAADEATWPLAASVAVEMALALEGRGGGSSRAPRFAELLEVLLNGECEMAGFQTLNLIKCQSGFAS